MVLTFAQNPAAPGSKCQNRNTRVQTQSEPVCDDNGKCRCREEICSELVVARGDAAEIFDAAVCIFDEMAVTVHGPVVADRSFAVGTAGNDRNLFACAQRSAQCVGIIALVGNDVARRGGTRQEFRRSANVGNITGTERCRERPADNVGQEMDFRRLTTP